MRLPRRLKFRLLAVLLGLLPFLLLEIGLRVFGPAEPPLVASFDQEFHRNRPLFVLSDDGERYEIAENRRLYFAQESFPSQKSPGTLRVFVVGGSTVQGRPFSLETSFPTFLKKSLQCCCPSIDWQVVNCGGISYGTHRLQPIVSEVSQYQPDLIIICTGHNEFLEHVSYQFDNTPVSRQWAHRVAAYSQTIRWVRSSFTKRIQLPEEVDTTLDHVDGLEFYRRTTLRREGVLASFKSNLKSMISECRRNHIPTLLIAPPSNLRDCSPFKSEFTNETSRQAVEHLMLNLQADSDLSETWKAICQADPQYALGWYQLGKVYLTQRRYDQAIEAFRQAIDEDICPLRMTFPQRNAMAEVAEDTQTQLIDLQRFVAGRSRHAVIGNDVLVDHVHPAFRTNHEIAMHITPDVLQLLNETVESADWESVAEGQFDPHMQSLDNSYFLSGRRSLQTLEDWSRGRGDGPALRGDPRE